MGGFPSGQRGQTVNLLLYASVVRIHLHPVFVGGISVAGIPFVVYRFCLMQHSCGAVRGKHASQETKTISIFHSIASFRDFADFVCGSVVSAPSRQCGAKAKQARAARPKYNCIQAGRGGGLYLYGPACRPPDKTV